MIVINQSIISIAKRGASIDDAITSESYYIIKF